jgi:hypothetical protein
MVKLVGKLPCCEVSFLNSLPESARDSLMRLGDQIEKVVHARLWKQLGFKRANPLQTIGRKKDVKGAA